MNKFLFFAVCLALMLISKDTVLADEPSTNASSFQQIIRGAEKGDEKAQFFLGLCYALGQHIEKNNDEAVNWWLKSANQGYARAQFKLGLAYVNGQGVSKSLVMAYGWLLLAKTGGYTDESSHLETLEKSLSASELKVARSWANEWKPKPAR